MLKQLNAMVINPLSWWLLATSALAFELCALFFQYGMSLEPCIMCIYQRVAILGVLTAGVIGAVGNQYLIARLLGFILWAISSLKGLQLALEHVEMQKNAGSLFYTCDIVPNFPSWMPIHEWIPVLFEATGDCGEIAWSFAGYSMPQWMIVIFAAYFIVFAIMLISHIVKLLKK